MSGGKANNAIQRLISSNWLSSKDEKCFLACLIQTRIENKSEWYVKHFEQEWILRTSQHRFSYLYERVRHILVHEDWIPSKILIYVTWNDYHGTKQDIWMCHGLLMIVLPHEIPRRRLRKQIISIICCWFITEYCNMDLLTNIG